MRIIFTVTNDLSFDQRMHRICGSMAAAGYDVLLVGRSRSSSIPFRAEGFTAKRLRCLFNTGFLFYLEYNLRLFLFLLFQKSDAYCAIDLDTIVPVYFVSLIRKSKRIYDAHELFTEQKEIVSRKNIHRFWLFVERFAVPKFRNGYTVNHFIKEEFKRRYGVCYEVVRNLPVFQQIQTGKPSTPFMIYQGAVNEGRSFETLIPAMKGISLPLHIYGNGNFFEQVESMISTYGVEDKVVLHGYVKPPVLKSITPTAAIALTLFEKTGLNQYYSLSNRFFDYIMAGVPQICVNYPEYKAVNDVYRVAYMIDDTDERSIQSAVQVLLTNRELYNELKRNCMKAREILNWHEEEKKLHLFYRNLFNTGSNTYNG